jgi:hypothetical protein
LKSAAGTSGQKAALLSRLPARLASSAATATATAAATATPAVRPSAAPAATAESTTTAAESTAAAALRTRTGFVHDKRTAAEIGAVQCSDCLLCLIAIGHLDKCEPAGTSSVPVHHQVHGLHFAVGFKRPADVILGGRERQISYVQSLHGKILL